MIAKLLKQLYSWNKRGIFTKSPAKKKNGTMFKMSPRPPNNRKHLTRSASYRQHSAQQYE